MIGPPGGPGEHRNPVLRVAVVSCHDYAWSTVRALARVDGIAVVGFLQGDVPQAGLAARLRRFWRSHGPALGRLAMKSAIRKTRSMFGSLLGSGAPHPDFISEVSHVRLRSLNETAAVDALERLKPDILVVDGSNILHPRFYAKPPLGAINLHCGKLPEYRGQPPAFWELFHGESAVGVSVHAVSEQPDAGPVFATTMVPLEFSPSGDALEYIEQFWMERLRPVGIQLVAETLLAIADGTATSVPQRAESRRPFRNPSYREKRELQQRVARRRNGDR